MRRHAFTLIEMLVVIAIILVLVALILPALSSSKRAAQGAIGEANLRSAAAVMTSYTTDFKDYYVYPWNRLSDDAITPEGEQWYDIRSASNPDILWTFYSTNSYYHTEMFAAYWYSYVLDQQEGQLASEAIVSPADLDARRAYESVASRANGDHLLVAGSYLYSPTFWMKPERYPCNARDVMTAAMREGQASSSVTFPSQKVVIWERVDVSTRSPMVWNQLEATTAVTTADGSVRNVKMRDVYAAADTDENLIPAGLGGGSPTSVIAPKDRVYDQGSPLPNTGNPLFFWATQHGVEGRDF